MSTVKQKGCAAETLTAAAHTIIRLLFKEVSLGEKNSKIHELFFCFEAYFCIIHWAHCSWKISILLLHTVNNLISTGVKKDANALTYALYILPYCFRNTSLEMINFTVMMSNNIC